MNFKFNNIILLVFAVSATFKISAQENKEIDAVLSKKIEYNKSHPFGDGYRIQLYNGKETTAYEVKKEYELKFDNDAELSYESPEWKVRVGHYSTRLEADRALLTIKEKFKGAIVLATKIRR